MVSNGLKSVICFSLLVAAAFAVTSCANRVIPGGGRVDHLAPVLLETSPEAGALNFSGSEIVITFDEYVQLKGGGEAIAVSPPIEPAPRAVIRKKSVVVELPDSLQPNTTYTIDFGDAITDVNESNPVTGYQFVFSTGSVIDTLAISGTILDALTMKPVSGALAVAFPSDIPDTLLGVTRPSYFARAGDRGNFTISNMRPGSYRIFGLDDVNSNLRANLPDEKLGFLNATVEPGGAPITLRASRHLPLKQYVVSSALAEPGRLEVAFAKPVSTPSWQFLSGAPEKVLHRLNATGDTLSLIYIPRNDSVQVVISDAGVVIDTVVSRLGRGSNEALAAGKYMMWSTDPAPGSTLLPGTDPDIHWPVPVTQFQAEAVSVFRDTVAVPATITHNDKDGTFTRISASWIEGNYRITLNPGAVTDVFGRQNDTIRVTFSVPQDRTRGSLSYILPESTTPRILQLVTEKDEVKRQTAVPPSGKGEFAGIDPGVYRLRLITDSNGNGRWDTGNLRERKQPEEVSVYAEPVTVRANWELEVVWK